MTSIHKLQYFSPMRSFILASFLICVVGAFGQSIKLKVIGQPDTTVHLVKYFGSKLFYADTAEIKNGVVSFDGKKQKPGMFALLLPGQQYFEFVYNNENVFLETKKGNFMESMKVRESKENKVFMDYVNYIGNNKKKMSELSMKIDSLEKDSKEYNAIKDEISTISKSVEDYQKNVIASNPDLLISKIVKMSMDIDIPEAPKDENGNIIDSSFQYNYYKAHYFDNFDFKDDRLVNSPIFHNKMEYYFSNKMLIQHWDTIIKYAYNFCDQLEPGSKTFEYCVSWITTHYGKSQIMGMDKVYVMMADKYYCTRNEDGSSPAFWMTEEKLTDLCDKIKIQKNLVMGVQPPNIRLRDTTDVNWVGLNDMKGEYVILYFWDPECGHCKKITPKLQTLYAEKFKDRDIDVFAVGKAIGDDFEKWKKFIRDNELEFTNVAMTESLYKAAQADARQFIPKYTNLESLNYQKTYDIYATPRVFVLDKDRNIIAKQISIAQLEDLMDRLQDKQDLPKIFPIEEESEDDQMH